MEAKFELYFAAGFLRTVFGLQVQAFRKSSEEENACRVWEFPERRRNSFSNSGFEGNYHLLSPEKSETLNARCELHNLHVGHSAGDPCNWASAQVPATCETQK